MSELGEARKYLTRTWRTIFVEQTAREVAEAIAEDYAPAMDLRALRIAFLTGREYARQCAAENALGRGE